MEKKIIIIVGPTASGKTALAVRIAKSVGGEVISADSRAVYRGVRIGANVPSIRERRGVPHHLFEIRSPRRAFSAAEFVRLTDRLIHDIVGRGKVPIIAGGTGLYVDALLRRITIPEVPPNAKLRRQLEKKSASDLFVMLQKLDPRRAKSIECENPRRLIRAIEIAKAIGKSPPPHPLRGGGDSPYNATIIGVSLPQKTLEMKIKARAVQQIRRGLIAETKRLREKEKLSKRRINELGFEYRLAAGVLLGTLPRSSLADRLAAANIKYAKRQLRYLRRNPSIYWVSRVRRQLHYTK